MAIKIDLLPRYVGLQRRFNLLWKVAAGFLLGTVVILALIYARGETDLRNLRAELKTAEIEAGYTNTAQTAANRATEAAVALDNYSQFMVNASQTGAKRAALIDLVARYVTPGAVVNSIDMSSGTTAVITATLRSPDDYARFLLGLRSGSASRGGPVFAADPRTASVVPSDPVVSDQPLGYGRGPVRPAPATQPQVVSYPIKMTVVGTLKEPITIPAEPSGGTTTAATSPSGSSGPGGRSGAPGAASASPSPTSSP